MKPNNHKEIIHSLSTIGDFIRFSVTQFEQADLFYGHGTDNAWDEAMYLILGALHLSFDKYDEVLACHLIDEERKMLVTMLRRRIETRMPVAYILGKAWFAQMCFNVDKRVLIPRSPIAELIMHQFSPWLDNIAVSRILDIGTGCGCIACACAEYFPECEVDAIDISQEALDVAKQNARMHGLEERVHFYHSDLFSALSNDVAYQLIIANIPYVSTESMRDLPAEYNHEPVLALEAGIDGLDIVIPLLACALDYLTEDGIIVIEVGESEQALIAQCPELPFLWLEFEHGGQGVFLLTAEQLRIHRDVLQAQL